LRYKYKPIKFFRPRIPVAIASGRVMLGWKADFFIILTYRSRRETDGGNNRNILEIFFNVDFHVFVSGIPLLYE
jgi:hypothetical protein